MTLDLPRPSPLASLCVPAFRRLDEYLAVWAMHEPAFLSHWELLRAADLSAHVLASLDSPPRLHSRLSRLPVGKGKSIARIDVAGTLMKQQSSFGGTSTVQLRRDIREAAADPDVSAILLTVDSPGGTVAGTEDLAAEVLAARRKKMVWAHADDLAASAAYWVASQAEEVWANGKTALVGSIGTLMTVYDLSSAAEKQGVKALVFGTGPLKGAGFPGSEVTEEQRNYFRSIVERTQKSFDAAVQKGRRLTDRQLADVRTGGVFLAEEAQERKLIDGVRPLAATIEALSVEAARRSRF